MKDGVSAEERRALAAVPVSEDEALTLAQTWGDAEVRNRTMAMWTDFARDKYGTHDEPLLARLINAITLIFPMGIAACVIAYAIRRKT